MTDSRPLHQNQDADPLDFVVYFITWTTYGTWLPGDARGWRKRQGGPQVPQPLLEDWCRERLKGNVVLLEKHDRETVEDACREHSQFRGWQLLAARAQSNHVHVVIGARADPETVRDQLKANCTRRLRTQPIPLVAERTWTRLGDCEVLETEEEIAAAVQYTMEGQDKSRTR
jgi:REP element-mobilizing transposase RayT